MTYVQLRTVQADAPGTDGAEPVIRDPLAAGMHLANEST